MAVRGSNTKQEILFRQEFKALSKSIADVETKITMILKEAYDSPVAGAKYWNKVRRDLNTQYKKLNVLYTTWAKVKIPKAYRESMRGLFSSLNKSRNIARKAKKTFSQVASSGATLSMTKALYNDAITDYIGALKTGQDNLNRITRKTQQLLLEQSIIDESVARAIESGNLLSNKFYQSKYMMNTLASQLKAVAEVIDNKYYVQAGKKRFTAKYYAEMVSRVKFHEAQAYSAMQTANNYGTSLVKVSYHNTRTAICVQYENMIFSIGGKDPRFPVLYDTPPFHPNCLHNLYPVFVEALEATGTLKQWSEFSNGRVSIPPSPPSFISPSERGL